MNKTTFLMASIVMALTGCGGSNSDGDSSSITAIDGYLSNAELWIDMNDNLSLDSADIKLDSNTDTDGKFTLPNEYKTHALFVKAISGQTIDTTRGLVQNNFVLATPASFTVASPMTNMIVELLAVNPGMTQAEAEERVVQSVIDSGLVVSSKLIFGDYLADSSQQAQALNIIGETLVDHAELAVEKQLELASGVADVTKNVIDDQDKNLDNFSPAVEILETGALTVSANTRPVHNFNGRALKPLTLNFDDTWSEFNASQYFSDGEHDVLTYKLKELKGKLNGLSIDANTGIVSGDLTSAVAGTFDYQLFASDSHAATSYPLNFTVTIVALDNSTPETETPTTPETETPTTPETETPTTPETETPEVSNLAVNGDFESWSDTKPTGWTAIDSGIEVLQNSTTYKTGLNSAEIIVNTSVQGNTDFRQYVEVKAGGTYTASLWVYHTEGGVKARLFVANYTDVYSDPNLVNQWQQLTFSYQATEDANIEVGMRFYDDATIFDGSEAVYVDDYTFIADATDPVDTATDPVDTVDTVNLLLNGDFNGSMSSWTLIDSGIEVTENTNISKAGSSAAITVNTGAQGNTDFRQSINVTAGETYTASLWVYHTEGGVKARLFVADYTDVYSDLTLTEQWQELTFSYEATENKSIEVGVRFYDDATIFDGSEVVYIDDYTFVANAVTDPVVPTVPGDFGTYYDSVTGKTGLALKTALYDIVKDHTSKTYTPGVWEFMAANSLDHYYEKDNSILDMYSEIPSASDSYNFTPVTNQCGNYSGEGSCYNREHSFPKSWFNDGYPMYTDIHHIFATDGYVNGRRSNHPFGEVGNASWTSTNGSKLGSARAGLGYTGTVFEPIDEFKGDFARAYFYMATRYEDKIGGWENNGTGADAMLAGNGGLVFETWVIDMLKVWHENDAVSQKEIDRNVAAFAFQGNRNPFVDHPEYVSLIWAD